ncbi:MAG: 3'-5' exoribonuclease YhaM family protein [bacterium]
MITDLKAGETIVSFFVLRKKEIKTRRESNEIYLSLELGDASGRIFGSVWDEPQKSYQAVEKGDVVKVKATVIDFRDRLHLNIEKLRKVDEKDEVDIKQLVPACDKDLKKLIAQLDELIASVSNTHLKHLLSSIFDDRTIRTPFETAPGGKLWHHNYLGGLLEHTLSVTEIADKIGQMYPDVNRDLLVTAGLLHDIGKIDSYRYDTMIDFTDEGRLLGHIVIGAQLVSERIKSLSEFPKELAKQLVHLILSHQGKLEQASPVVPMTLEGIILYYADEFDAKANAFLRIRKKEGHKRWSSYVNLLGQYFYFGSENA